MKTKIIIHATSTPADHKVTIDDITDLNSTDRYSDPLPYHYIVNTDGTILKGRKDRETCGHCATHSRDSFSIAYAGGIDPETHQPRNTISTTQTTTLTFLINQLLTRNPNLTIHGANQLLHPDQDPITAEPYFDVPQWLKQNGIQTTNP